MSTKITQAAKLDAFGASSNGEFLETHAHARRRSKTAFMVFNTDAYSRGVFPFGSGAGPAGSGLHYTIAAIQDDTASNSESNLSYRGDTLTPGGVFVDTGTATDAMRKNAKLWCMVGPPRTEASKEVVRRFIYRGGGALIVSSVVSWPDWVDTFGSFPAIEPYYLNTATTTITSWAGQVPGVGGNNVIENGLYGRVTFTGTRGVVGVGKDLGPLPVFSNDEGSLQVSVNHPASAKDKTSLYSTFTFGAGRVIVSPVPIGLALLDPALGTNDPMAILARNMVAWVNKQYP